MGLIGSTPKMDETEKKIRDEIDDQIAQYKIFMISKKSCPFCRTAKVSFYIITLILNWETLRNRYVDCFKVLSDFSQYFKTVST